METSEEKQGARGTGSADPIEEPQGASRGDEGGKGHESTTAQDGPDTAAGKADGDGKEEKDGRRKVPVIILLILALLLACAGGFMLWKSMQPDIDPGATIHQAEEHGLVVQPVHGLHVVRPRERRHGRVHVA